MKFQEMANHVAAEIGSQGGLSVGEGSMLDIVEVSSIFNVSPQVARDWCRRGVIPSVKIGRRLYIPRDALAAQIQGAIDVKGTSHPATQQRDR